MGGLHLLWEAVALRTPDATDRQQFKLQVACPGLALLTCE